MSAPNFKPIDLIVNLLIATKNDSNYYLRAEQDIRSKAAFNAIIDQIDEAIHITFVRNQMRFTNDQRERFAAIELANVYDIFNRANFARHTSNSDFKYFRCVTNDSEKIERTKNANIVCEFLRDAIDNTNVRTVLVDIRRSSYFGHDIYDQLFRSPVGDKSFRDRMLEINPQQFLDLALKSANVDMILQFARRPAPESHYRKYQSNNKKFAIPRF